MGKKAGERAARSERDTRYHRWVAARLQLAPASIGITDQCDYINVERATCLWL